MSWRNPTSTEPAPGEPDECDVKAKPMAPPRNSRARPITARRHGECHHGSEPPPPPPPPSASSSGGAGTSAWGSVTIAMGERAYGRFSRAPARPARAQTREKRGRRLPGAPPERAPKRQAPRVAAPAETGQLLGADPSVRHLQVSSFEPRGSPDAPRSELLLRV